MNGLGDLEVAEPFAGGAGAALSMLFFEDTHHIRINDIDSNIFDFWWALLNQSSRFLKLIDETPLSVSEWENQRKVHRSPSRYSRVRRGFATFYLNRCNRSGIILKGGPIGGFDQKGKWKIDARFNRKRLRERCERVLEYKDRITVSDKDGAAFLERRINEDTFFFIDPPYYRKGPTLYLNALNSKYHEKLARSLRKRKNSAWVLTYDDCPEIRGLYKGWANIRPYRLRYTASNVAQGHELCITPKWMNMPGKFMSPTIQWFGRQVR